VRAAARLVKLGMFLSDDTPLASATLRALMSMFPKLKGADILSALRLVIRFIRLPSEAQRLTRYLTAFCETYVATNPKLIKSADHAFTLCYALLVAQRGDALARRRRQALLERAV
jgi:Sec7-like guanine-nucleotide exchange factor